MEVLGDFLCERNVVFQDFSQCQRLEIMSFEEVQILPKGKPFEVLDSESAAEVGFSTVKIQSRGTGEEHLQRRKSIIDQLQFP